MEAAQAAGGASCLGDAFQAAHELSFEYDQTTSAQENASALLVPSTVERVKQVGVTLLSPLDDAGGTPSGPSDPERVVMLPWEASGLNEETRVYRSARPYIYTT